MSSLKINYRNIVPVFRLVVIVIGFILVPSIVQALGMSEMKVLSTFGEEFVAEVELYGVDPKDPDLEDFFHAFIEPVADSLPGIHAYVKNIKINFVRGDGKVKLMLNHPEYYTEPYIEFSIYLSSGNINITRTFTALIDFPQARISTIPVQPKPDPQISTQYIQPEITGPTLWQQTSGTRTVRPGETLYTIAREFQRQNGGDIHQIMEAIFSVNQHAFINNDRNLIMAGSHITFPDGPVVQQVREPVETIDIDQLDEYGPVLAGDSLYKISRRYRQYYEDSIPKLADRIFNLNPHAFIRNDINLLRQGVILKLPPQDQATLEGEVGEPGDMAAPATDEVKEDQYLEILVPTDDESPGEIIAETEEEQVKKKLEDTMVDLEDVVRENSELKNSVEVSKKQINVLQQNLDESNIKIEELQAQINELKDQTEASTTQVPVSPDKTPSDGIASTTMVNLVEGFDEYPWTVLLIITVVGVAFIVLIILINKIRSPEILLEKKDFEIRERVPDNELKARIKQKLSQRDFDDKK